MRRIRVLAVDQDAVLAHDRSLYRALHQMGGLDIAVLVPESWKSDFGSIRAEREEATTMQVFPHRTLFTGRSHRAVYLGLPRILREYKPDILYLNAEPESYLAWQSVMIRRRISPGTKIVFISWRNIDYPKGEFPYKLSFLNALAERAVVSEADHCIAHSESAREIFYRKGFRQVSVIPPAVDTTSFKREHVKSDRMKLKSGPFTIGYVGRFISDKGVDLLLHAARLLSFEHLILLAGDGPARSSLKELAQESGISDRVMWVDPVPHADIPTLLNRMDVLVLPSRTGKFWKEQFGRVLIEAMACGVPVIGSTSGEIPNVIGGAGLVFEEGNPGALALGLQKMFDDERLRADLSRTGIERVRKKYAVPIVAEAYYALFANLINPSPGNPEH